MTIEGKIEGEKEPRENTDALDRPDQNHRWRTPLGQRKIASAGKRLSPILSERSPKFRFWNMDYEKKDMYV